MSEEGGRERESECKMKKEGKMKEGKLIYSESSTIDSPLLRVIDTQRILFQIPWLRSSAWE